MNTIMLAELFCYLFIIVIFTRILPYVFADRLKSAKMVTNIGKQLPAYIMFLLLIYEIDIQTFFESPYGLYEIIALLLLTVVHFWKRNMLLSLLVGSSGYLLLLHYF